MRPIRMSRPSPFIGQVTLSLDERNALLAKIQLYREMMGEINEYTKGVPTWASVDPFGKAQPEFDKALDVAFKASDAVRDIETRLSSSDGPWRKMNDAESSAFSAWTSGIDAMYAIYQASKPDAKFDVRAAGAAGAVGILFTIAIMGA